MAKGKLFAALFCFIIICTVTLSACTNASNSYTERVAMHASWAYNFRDVQDLTENSDLIAYVSVASMESYKESGIAKTKYVARVIDELHGEGAETVEIVMTGGIIDKILYELDDDPLMEINDRFLIFARKNTTGTYTVLSGSQGRLVMKDDRVYSLNAIDSEVARANPHSNIKVNGVDKDALYSQIKSYLPK